ncbi:MAG: hypothetical protein DRQ61_11495 [Gammaproteobacteria bacterium]|nr:MAG: hypothetical protein DRQ61_11495 [Gammaproteobacteria bacterium]RLA52676.1 MAG: hypothetical protein DRR42_06875 [Gammaproteobacteria bacterium]
MIIGFNAAGYFIVAWHKNKGAFMLDFQVESWMAVAPGLESHGDWCNWLQNPQVVQGDLGSASLKQISPMLRRRFGVLGKCAVGAALPLVNEGENIPSIFASRHGDTPLTLSLLEGIGRNEPMSPTGFSLAVHNAVSGLFSIARKDVSGVTAVAAVEGLILQTLLEASGQLLTSGRVLCVVYDVPLPALYHGYCEGVARFPYAIAFILSHKKGKRYRLMQDKISRKKLAISESGFSHLDPEAMGFLEILTGLSTEMRFELNGRSWRLRRVCS